MRNHSYENDFDLHENGDVCRTHFHMKGFTLRLVLKERHKRTRKWPILNGPTYNTTFKTQYNTAEFQTPLDSGESSSSGFSRK